MNMVWTEKSSRGLARGQMNNYSTVADALFEIIDNPIDYRRGRKLTINVEVDRDNDLVVVEDYGGEGMDAEGIADWLNWGSGHPHEAGDIGRYHYGGKAATGFLCDSLRLVARKAGASEIWEFTDEEWATREDWGSWEAKTIEAETLPEHLRQLPEQAGFVRIEMRKLHKGRRYRLEDLKQKLSSVYRKLLQDEDIIIVLGGEPVKPLELPESSAFTPVEIHERLPNGRILKGRIWRLDRDALVSSKLIRGGIRTLFNGRLITSGEWFGHNLEGKGLLASLIGEIDLSFCTPVPTKNAWVQETEDWEYVEKAMKRILAPIVAEFRRAGEANQVTREERKRAAEVHRQLEEALQLLRQTPPEESSGHSGKEGDLVAAAGRAPAAEGDGRTRKPYQGGTRGELANPTPPPDDAVGILPRLVKRKQGLPELRLQPLDGPLRSGRDVEDGRQLIIINNNHPMYRELEGCSDYIAETAILELLLPQEEDDEISASEYYGQVIQLLHMWYRVAGSVDTP